MVSAYSHSRRSGEESHSRGWRRIYLAQKNGISGAERQPVFADSIIARVEKRTKPVLTVDGACQGKAKTHYTPYFLKVKSRIDVNSKKKAVQMGDP